MPPLTALAWIYLLFIASLLGLSVVHAFHGVLNYGGLSNAHLHYQAQTLFSWTVAIVNLLHLAGGHRSRARWAALLGNLLLAGYALLHRSQDPGTEGNTWLLVSVGLLLVALAPGQRYRR